MGLSLSFIFSAWEELLKHKLYHLACKISPSLEDGDLALSNYSFMESESDAESIPKLSRSDEKTTLTRKSNGLKISCPVSVMLEKTASMKNFSRDRENTSSNAPNSKSSELKSAHKISLPDPAILYSPKPVSELDAAAVKLQKVYKSYRTRRNLADCAVVVEELWWKALDFAALKRSSVSFFNDDKPETAISRWARARTRAAKVGKGLSKHGKAQKLALQHWLEAIDPRHRYGHNLHLYYDVWFASESCQPFFFWLDVGDGKEVNLESCPRTSLQRQCIQYLGPQERQSYEVIVENGKLVYRQSGILVDTTEGCKWIFVLSTANALYVGQKKKGLFQHSSFLAGGATTAAGRLVAHGGVLEAIWSYSGHYRPTEENFREFISFLEEHCVNLSNVKRYALDDDIPPVIRTDEESRPESTTGPVRASQEDHSTTTNKDNHVDKTVIIDVHHKENKDAKAGNVKPPLFEVPKRLSCKWSTGAGPRIGCVRDYPPDLQCRALEQVNLSPRMTPGSCATFGPIPSPRPSPKVRLSPRLAYMGLPSPRTSVAAAN